MKHMSQFERGLCWAIEAYYYHGEPLDSIQNRLSSANDAFDQGVRHALRVIEQRH